MLSLRNRVTEVSPAGRTVTHHRSSLEQIGFIRIRAGRIAESFEGEKNLVEECGRTMLQVDGKTVAAWFV